ncbi:MAG: HNH endonuclease [Cellvibrio sp.]|nr:HNH endonuclease [Cellvibrio sp.]
MQFARLHLVNEGLLYKQDADPSASRGYWKITPKGEISASKATGSILSLEEQISADLNSQLHEENFEEGGKKAKLVSYYERNSALRVAAIKIHGTTCKACGFNFFKTYGEIGMNYIEVHHIVPISNFIEVTSVNPKTDLVVLCSNCHRMVHRNKENPLSIEQLQKLLKGQ